MPLTIARVETEMDVGPERRAPRGVPWTATEEELCERLRPVVLRILEDELARLWRERR